MKDKVSDKHREAVEQFNRQAGRNDGDRVAESLEQGLNLVRNLFYERMHFDVEKIIGTDSMFIPLSEMKTCLQCKSAIDVYQIVESAWAVRQFGFLRSGDDWYLPWLEGQRLAATLADETTARQIQRYRLQTPDQRRRELMDILLDMLPESGRAPLVLFSLVPLSVQLVTALAFGDRPRGEAVRKQQQDVLPALADCRDCHGAVLVNGKLCNTCGNPLWKFAWLTST
ncbi:MAG: hypothetical protein NTY19_33770 [Planctomycetota bacterium]|nr:hypothetical protein [Planctomycetota bacterium]